MKIDCLLVLENNYLLNFALASILSPESGIVAARSKASDFLSLVEEIRNLKTHVVIIEESAKMAEKYTLANLLVSQPTLKIIVVKRDSNFIQIYRRDEIALNKSADLLKEIHSV